MLEPVDDQYLIIAHIVNAHGVKGEVLVQPDIETPGLFDGLQLVHYQNARSELVPARIEWVRPQRKGNRLSFFVKFEHVSDRNEAAALKGSPIFIRRDTFPAIEEEAPASEDYRSWSVCREDGSPLGTVTGMMDNPAHLILEVTTEEGSEILVPFVEEYITQVDEEAEEIRCRKLDQLAGL